jgi:hypothetical protein
VPHVRVLSHAGAGSNRDPGPPAPRAALDTIRAAHDGGPASPLTSTPDQVLPALAYSFGTTPDQVLGSPFIIAATYVLTNFIYFQV